MKKERKTKVDVLFLKGQPIGELYSEVIAYFPKENYSNDKNLKVCYQHIGQHGSCHIDYAKECREAYYNEYQDLLKELNDIGYKVNILNTQPFEFNRKPTQAEIKFGEGATHYRMFTANEIGLNKKGLLKTVFKAKDDNLFYSSK